MKKAVRKKDRNKLKEKRVPERMCIACGQMKPKKDLLRIVQDENGISFDPGGRKNGRGAYLCPSEECLEAAFKKKALDRSFKTHVSEETYESLKTTLLELL